MINERESLFGKPSLLGWRYSIIDIFFVQFQLRVLTWNVFLKKKTKKILGSWGVLYEGLMFILCLVDSYIYGNYPLVNIVIFFSWFLPYNSDQVSALLPHTIYSSVLMFVLFFKNVVCQSHSAVVKKAIRDYRTVYHLCSFCLVVLKYLVFRD